MKGCTLTIEMLSSERERVNEWGRRSSGKSTGARLAVRVVTVAVLFGNGDGGSGEGKAAVGTDVRRVVTYGRATSTVPTRGLHESPGPSPTAPITYSMGPCISTISRLRSTRRIDQGAISGHFQPTERIGQDTIGDGSQRQRYA